MKLKYGIYALILLLILIVPSSVFAMSEGNCSKFTEYKWYGYSIVVKGEETIESVSSNPSISDYFNNKFKSGEINPKDVNGIRLFLEDNTGNQYSLKAQTNIWKHIKCANKLDKIQGATVEPVSTQDPETVESRIATYKCSDLETTEVYIKVLKPSYTFIRYGIPALLVILCSYDFLNATISDNADKMKQAQKKAVTRLLVGLVIMFLPTILNALLNIIGDFSTCGVGM